MTPMQGVLSNVEATLNVLADTVLMEQPPIRRRKLEHLVREIYFLNKFFKNIVLFFFIFYFFNVSEFPSLLHLRSQSWCINVT